jgi:signal transduction histidine kinase
VSLEIETKIKQNNKHQRTGKRASFAARLMFLFALTAATTALITLGVVSFVWELSFNEYTSENLQTIADKTAKDIGTLYEKNKQWNTTTLAPARNVTSYAPDIGVQVFAWENNQTLYDSTVILNDIESQSLAPTQGDKMRSAKIVVDGEVVGQVKVWVHGSETVLRQTDQTFRDDSYRAIIFASVVAIVLASCVGFVFSQRLTNPIKRITKVANTIKGGDLTARTNMKGSNEIERLGETFDAMAESIENDRVLERRLTTDVAHELRTPLMAIQSTVEAMVDGVFVADKDRLETVNSEVERLSRLVDALLRLSRLESRTSPIKRELVDVSEVIAGIVATHEAFVSDSGLTLSFESDDEVCVLGDADMIRQAVANLISNAVRYTPEGGSIVVSVRKGDLMAIISVQDTGIGLSPDEAKMVFSRFWRADAGRNREYGGLGVGLTVVKEIVDRHGGWVRVEGKKNEGAKFTVYIPLYNEDQAKRKTKRKG